MPRRPSLGRPGGGSRSAATRAVHPPAPPEQPGHPIAPLLDPSSTYAFSNTEDFASASSAKVGEGYVYARWANRTVDAFEAAVADLEGTSAAEAFASGMAAISAVFLGLCSAGDRIVATRQLYGNTHSLLTHRLPRYGIQSDLFDIADFAGIADAIPGAKLLFCETISNPRVEVCDLPRLGSLARDAGVPFVVDNTFASPMLCRPAEHGASAIVHSATKYLGGHHDLLGGVVCGDHDIIDAVRAVGRDLGGSLAPFNAWLALRGIATLPLRVEHSSASALQLAHALEAHPDIEGVYYPALEGSHSKSLCDALMRGRGGGTLGFDVNGGTRRAGAFQEALELVTPAASLGGTHTLIVHAASVTHTQLSSQELAAAGISEGFCRLSVGLEDPADLLADIEAALEATA